MPRKHVAVAFHRSPIGTNGCVEGLRAAVGLTAGTEENTVVCAFFSHAVLFALGGADRDEAGKHLDTLAAMGVPLLVDEEALDAHGIPPETVAAPFRVADRLMILTALHEAEASLGF